MTPGDGDGPTELGLLASARRLLRLLPLGPLRDVARRVYHRATANRAGRVRIGDLVLRLDRASMPPPAHASGNTARHDRRMLAFFCELVRPGTVVADVGAFRGTYTVVAAARTGPDGHVHAFEPTELSRAAILHNLAANRLSDRVTLVDAAVADFAGETSFFRRGPDSAHSTNTLVPPGDEAVHDPTAIYRESRTRVVMLDEYFTQAGRWPQVVKIDIEGAEFAALRGAERLLAQGATVLCELHPDEWTRAGHTAEDLIDWLSARGRVVRDLEGRVADVLTYGPYLLGEI